MTDIESKTLTINNWENKGNIPQDKLSAMADLFGTTTDYLLSI